MNIDHVVLWVESPKRALDFYVGVLGLAPMRAQDFEEDRASFPSVRLNRDHDSRSDGPEQGVGRRGGVQQ